MVSEGQVLDGTYRLRRVIGEGGMGVVYEASHARLAGRYAIKVLLENLAESPDLRARFDREARVTSLLQHPNVVQVIDHNTTADGIAYLVMEYLDGESLAQRKARRGCLALAEVIDIVDQIAAGLTAAHAQGIVHRDLKPDNVILVPVAGRGGELVKILDFGISKVRGSGQTAARELCGTPQYMAPEQVEGRLAEVDAATDQFALAILAYELLTGSNPFMADELGAIFSRVVQATPPPAGAGVAVDAVLARGMAKARDDRFPTIRTFADALEAAGRAAVPDVRPVATPAYPAGEIGMALTVRKPAGRNRGLPLVLAAAACVATVLYSNGSNPLRFLGPGAARSATPAVDVDAGAGALGDAGVAPPPAVEQPARETAPTPDRPTDRAEMPAPAKPRERPRPPRKPPPRHSPPTPSPDEDATMPLSDG